VKQPGTYRARGIKGSQKFGRASTGNDQVAVRFVEVDDEGKPGAGMAWWVGTFSENATERTVDSLLAAGWDGRDLATLDGLGSEIVEVELEEHEYTNRDGEEKVGLRIAWVNRPGRFAFKDALDTTAVRAMGHALRGIVAHLQQKHAKKGAPPAPSGGGYGGGGADAPAFCHVAELEGGWRP
jgi:hypothetical protein